MAIFLKIYPILLIFRGEWKHLLCFAIIMINAEGQTQLLDISINKTQLGGRKLEAHTPKQWPCSVQITRLAYKRCDYILFVAMAAYRQKGC